MVEEVKRSSFWLSVVRGSSIMYHVLWVCQGKKVFIFSVDPQSIDYDFIVRDCDANRWSVFVGCLVQQDRNIAFGGSYGGRSVVAGASDRCGTGNQ